MQRTTQTYTRPKLLKKQHVPQTYKSKLYLSWNIARASKSAHGLSKRADKGPRERFISKVMLRKLRVGMGHGERTCLKGTGLGASHIANKSRQRDIEHAKEKNLTGAA